MGNRNEATTRSQLIDRLFFECLGWSSEDMILEESQDGEYADYTFLLPRRVLIVEAKKEGDYFDLPAGMERLEFSIRSLMRDFPNLKAALIQAAGYCQSRGVPFGVVSNGHQLVAFVATRNDGLPPFDGKALVFASLEQMLSGFHDLWQVLSKPGVEEKRLRQRLVGDIRPTPPAKLSASVPHYPGTKIRNIFQTDLQLVSELVMEDLVHTRDLETHFLEECYCQSGALSQYSLASKAILQARYDALFQSEAPGPATVPAVNKEGISSELLAESFSRRPVLLIGDVGVGKTSFIRYLINVAAVPLFEQAITLYIDMGSQATLTQELRSFVLDEMQRQLLEDYQIDIEDENFVRWVYQGELLRFSRGIYRSLLKTDPSRYQEREIEFLENKLRQREQHLKQVLHAITKAQTKQIVVFLDNADQRSEPVQQEVFLIAQELAEHWPATVFVALRPETFHRSMKIGALSGYHPKAFTISPPRIDLVIEKRLTFALKLTSGEIPIQSLSASTQVHLTTLDKIIRVFLYSLHRNGELMEFIDNISGGNVRAALSFVKGFFGSGHVDMQKIISIYDQTGQYMIPLHEFLRAVIFGDWEYYDPDRSPIANLFDVNFVDPKEHFLLPILIGLLDSTNNPGSDEGFIETSTIYERLQGLGFSPEQIDSAVVRGYKKNLLETAARRIPAPDEIMPEALRATTIGLYHIRRLSKFFAYIDAIIVDTPIFDQIDRQNIHNHNVPTLPSRLDRAEAFRLYLDRHWQGLNGAASGFNWRAVSSDLATDLARVKIRSERRFLSSKDH